MRRLLRVVIGAKLVAVGTRALIARTYRARELRRPLAGLDGTAPPLTYQELVDTDGAPVLADADGAWFLARPSASKKI